MKSIRRPHACAQGRKRKEEGMEIADLSRTAFFQGLTDPEIRSAIEALCAFERTYRKDERILSAGDTTQVMGLVLTGSVTIEHTDLWGRRTILSHAGEGQFFAETYAALPDAVLLVDVRANEDCRILFIRISRLGSLSGRMEPWLLRITQNLLRISMRKNLRLSRRSLHTAPKSARSRIMSYLYAVSLQKHAVSFDIPYDRQQMADYLNLDRTALSKELSRMKADGLIEYRKNHFTLQANTRTQEEER